MDEEKKQKPLLSYDEVLKIIHERIEQDENATPDRRIERIEKAAKGMENDKRHRIHGKRKSPCRVRNFLMRLVRCIKKSAGAKS